jgi:hypothetical protein
MAEAKGARVALYARVSTSNSGQSPEMQLRELREYCKRRGWTVAGGCVDTRISGAKDRRTELDRLMTDADKCRFDGEAVWKVDCFAHSVGHQDNVQWVQNVRAAGGRAVLRSGGRKEVQLEEVPADQSAPILKTYLQCAPGARPHVPVNKDAALSGFQRVAGAFPVFRVVSPAVKS